LSCTGLHDRNPCVRGLHIGKGELEADVCLPYNFGTFYRKLAWETLWVLAGQADPGPFGDTGGAHNDQCINLGIWLTLSQCRCFIREKSQQHETPTKSDSQSGRTFCQPSSVIDNHRAHSEITPGGREQPVISLELRAQPAMTFVIRE
jgi:hypothetical protein